MRLQNLIVLFIALSMSVFLLAGCQPKKDGKGGSSKGFEISGSKFSPLMTTIAACVPEYTIMAVAVVKLQRILIM